MYNKQLNLLLLNLTVKWHQTIIIWPLSLDFRVFYRGTCISPSIWIYEFSTVGLLANNLFLHWCLSSLNRHLLISHLSISETFNKLRFKWMQDLYMTLPWQIPSPRTQYKNNACISTPITKCSLGKSCTYHPFGVTIPVPTLFSSLVTLCLWTAELCISFNEGLI